ncbi:MAG: MFS transporter [Clostridia bacterium]|nr:MFS transporter [Clostridia bacterium]
MEMSIYDSKEYRRSRTAYIVQCTGEYFTSVLVTDAFLTRLLSAIGISDSLVGIISSFITLAFVIQLLSIQVVKAKISSKKLVMIFDVISVFCFMLMYLVPFVSASKEVKTILVTALVFFAYIGKYLVINVLFKWGNSFVEPKNRGVFSAGKETISLFCGMFFTAIMGYIIDKYESVNNLNGAFLFLSGSIFVLNICNFISLSLIAKEKVEDKKAEEPYGKVILKIIKNKKFRNVIFLTILYDTARYFTIGFLGVYKYKELMMSALLVQIINIVAGLGRMSVSKAFGRFSDKYSFAKGFELGLWLLAAGFVVNVFTTPSSWYLIIIFTVLQTCSYAGTNANSFNITYSYIDSEYIVQAMAVKNSIGGLFGFGASILGGKILDAVQSNGNTVFGIHVYGQQVLSLISFVIVCVAILFVRKVIEKQSIMVQ